MMITVILGTMVLGMDMMSLALEIMGIGMGLMIGWVSSEVLNLVSYICIHMNFTFAWNTVAPALGMLTR